MHAKLEPTYDPDTFLEAKAFGYRRYRRISDGRRWEVRGECHQRGDCLTGVPEGDLPYLLLPPDQRLDVPVTPEFRGCCEFSFAELEPLRGTYADRVLS